jgi:hypothetical protein
MVNIGWLCKWRGFSGTRLGAGQNEANHTAFEPRLVLMLTISR